MHREGHVGLGLFLYSPIAFVLFEFELAEAMALGLVAMVFWSFAPDFDMVLPIPHRGPTHSIPAAIGAGFLTALGSLYFALSIIWPENGLFLGWWVLSFAAALGFGFLIGFLGVVSHLIGDVLTPMGIRPWWPYSDRTYSLGLVLAADRDANKALSVAGGAAFVLALVASSLI